jgi:hypothetical protein
MTALSIAQRLGYISVVEELKVVTETTISTKQESLSEERYKVKLIIVKKFNYIFIVHLILDSSTRSIS